MHEMSFVTRFVNQAIASAEKNQAKKVTRVVVQVGEMTGILPEYLHKYFPIATKDTILQDAILETESIRLKVSCNKCKTIYYPKETPDMLCPSCQSGECHILEGKDMFLKEIEIEK